MHNNLAVRGGDPCPGWDSQDEVRQQVGTVALLEQLCAADLQLAPLSTLSCVSQSALFL